MLKMLFNIKYLFKIILNHKHFQLIYYKIGKLNAKICIKMSKFAELNFLLHPQPVLAHPLLQTISNDFLKNEFETNKEIENSDEKKATEDHFFDPLGASGGTQKIGSLNKSKECQLNSIKNDGIGPLDNTLAKSENDEEIEWPITNLDPSEKELIGFKPWKEIRRQILEQFNTADKLTIESSLIIPMSGGNKKSQQTQKINAAIKTTNKKLTNNGKLKSSANEQQIMMTKFYELTQNEWCRKMVELRKQLILKWREEKRLDCIKLIAELLGQLCGTICSAQFYPAQFIHCTDLLDLFGWLVWQRLMQFAEEERRMANLGHLPTQWTINDILGETRLKARNWFGKINQTVQQIGPRIYMLAAILPCQRFMDPWPGSGQENLLELCRGAQQIQHPLISSYLRSYLCKVGMRVQPTDRAPHWKCLNDWLQTYTQQPISFLWPAMEWIIQCVSFGAVNYEDLHPLWEYCRRMDKRPIVLVPMLNSLPRLYLGEHSLEACRIVTSSSELVTGEELCALGRNLLEAEIPRQSLKPILRSSWKCILRLGSLKEYLACCEYWCQFVCQHFTVNEVEIMMENIQRKLQQHSNCEHHIGQLLSILTKIFQKSREIHSILSMEIFAKLFDNFRSAPCQIRVQAAQYILESICQKHQFGAFTDVNIAYQILSICQFLHNSIELSAPSTQISEAIQLIIFALDRVDLRTDPDQCLAFLVACRAELSNWDLLQKYVIRRVQSFTLHIVRTIRYSTSRAAFLQGCLANLFISIPSLSNPFDRIELSIQSAQIALAAFAFLHVDSFIEFATDEFDELSSTALNDFSQKLVQIGKYFLAILSSICSIQEEYGGFEQPMKYFQRFLQKIICFQLPSQSFNQQNDRLNLLIHCLQFIFAIQSNKGGFEEIPKGQNNFVDGEMPAEELIKATVNGGNEDVKLARNPSGNAEILREICGKMTELIVEGIEMDFIAEKYSEKMCNLGMELLELVGQYGEEIEELSERLRGLVKIIYKKLRKKPMFIKRIERLKASTNGNRTD